MSVMVLKDDVVAELAFAQTRDNMMENNEDFPRVAHMAYLLLSDIIRKTHEHAYPDRHAEYRPPAHPYGVDDFTPKTTVFATPETLEGDAHVYEVAALYLNNVQGETSQFNDQAVIGRVENLAAEMLSRMIERKRGEPTQRIELELPLGDGAKRTQVSSEISALNAASPMLFETQEGLRTVTSRLLIIAPDANGRVGTNGMTDLTGPEVLRGLLLQGSRSFSAESPLFLPRLYPNSDGKKDTDLKQLFAEMSGPGDKNAVATEQLGEALTHIAALTESMLSRVDLLPASSIKGLDGVVYTDSDKKALVAGLRQVRTSLQCAATMKDRKYSGALPYVEAKQEYENFHTPSSDVYIFSRSPQRVIPEGDSCTQYVQDVRAYLQSNKVTATTEKQFADELMTKYGGTISGIKVAPSEINGLGPVIRGDRSRAFTLIHQAMFDVDVKSLHKTKDFENVMATLGLPSTPGIVDAMREGMERINGYDIGDPVSASMSLAHYTSARLPPAQRAEWEAALDDVSGVKLKR
jgi:hypothetical protein